MSDKPIHIDELDWLDEGRVKINKYAIDPANRAEIKSDNAIEKANHSADLASDANQTSENVDKRLDEILAGSMDDGEVIDARKNYRTLGKRLDAQDYLKETLELPNSLNRLTLVDAYDTLDAIHPKVLKFATRWNGFYWWQAFTPYPNGNQALENPHVLASNDMTTWVEPKGFKNPLDPQPSATPSRQYNSDTHLVFREDLNRLECWWRFVDEDADRVIIWRRTTVDGVKWTEKEVMIDWKKSTKDCVCPVVVFEDNLYKCWFVNDGYKMWYMTSANGKNWSNATEVLIPYESSAMKNWHHDIIHTARGYEMVIVSFENGTNRNEMSLYYSMSKDGLTDWSVAKKIIGPSVGRLGWDNRGLYRSSILYDSGVYYIFYSGINTNGNRGIGIAYGEDPYNLKGFQNLEAYIFNNMKAFNMVGDAYLRNYALKLVAPKQSGNWEGTLNHHSERDMKLSLNGNSVTSADLKNLLINALKLYEGILFQGKSAWLRPNELKLDSGSNVATLKVVDNGDIEVQRASGGPGTFKAQILQLTDNGTPQNVPEGTMRWASSRKKFMYFDGTVWKNLGE